MKLQLKSPQQLEKDLDSYKSRKGMESIPITLLDTGGLLDIIASTRSYEFLHRGRCVENATYCNALEFLKSIDKKCPLILTPLIFEEIIRHDLVKLNNHQSEVPSFVMNYVRELAQDSIDFMTGIDTQILRDDVRYDIHWIAQECCKENSKKCLEGFSLADKDILTNAAFLSKSSIKEPAKKQKNLWQILSLDSFKSKEKISLGPILVLSSDKHLENGVHFISKEFSEKYPTIKSIQTRC